MYVLLVLISIAYAIVTYIIANKTGYGEDKKIALYLHIACFIVFCLLMITTCNNIIIKDIRENKYNQSQYTMKPLDEKYYNN